MNAISEVSTHIAARVRARRAAQGWTLDELAARSGVSRRLLVGIEQSNANPSLATLLKLAAALGVSLAELIEEQPADNLAGRVPREDALTLWSTDAGSSAQLLVGRGPLELWTWRLQPGDRRDSQPHRSGAVELISVDEGTLTIEVGDERLDVAAEDSAWFDATHQHAYSNMSLDMVTFTLVVLEPARGGD